MNTLARHSSLSGTTTPSETLVNAATLAGRVGLGLLFVVSGFAPGKWSLDRR